jgi:hypothetical protein
MRIDVRLPTISTDDALGRLRAWLRRHFARSRRSHEIHARFQFSINSVIQELLTEVQQEHRAHNTGIITYVADPFPDSAPFHDAIWELCSRGIARPALTRPSGQEPRFTGTEFVLTSYGEEWVQNHAASDVVPSEQGRFAALLSSYDDLFGPAFRSRSQEALACYHAHAYLACCAMCGAAAEAILLALAIARSGDRDATLRDYRRASGRSIIERRLAAGQNSHVQSEMANFTSLLKYWRDDASHGDQSRLSESEAFTAMLLLLRFATFGKDRWAELTTGDVG